MADYPTNPRPVYPIEEQPAEPDVLITTHRDGSEQRRRRGNGKGRVWKLVYGTGGCPITQAERDVLLNHYNANGTFSSFTFHHPERTGESYVTRHAERPSSTLVALDSYELTVVLQEVPA